MSFSDQELQYLVDISYWVDNKKQDKAFLPKVNDIRKFPNKIKGDNGKYKILKVEDNHKNGMQAMAVAPIKNGKVDTSEVVIAMPAPTLTIL